MDLQVLRAGEHLATAGEGAGEGLLTGVDSDVGDVPLAPEESFAARLASAM